ncbi:hypothetical protein G7074_14795 [Pedobacter sp. HDW13]|uniref:Qat anti-phage system associated protein QatB n=1 Tax=Pedobacter sp. HDW13 TaxID=2714940 RepID=UPI00140B5115|nr:Qat anti-phage system associated protein QatB [Pedobacter sp. HDW13]QIL40422.1 hypothetical protein G7074_14795 [Pedobacter sp. HDW13]
MGTSASNNGPVGRSPLLPPWYQPSAGTGENNYDTSESSPDKKNNADKIDSQPNWTSGKGALKRLANGTRGSSMRKAGAAYVRSSGGATSATRAAAIGSSTGARFAVFLGGVAAAGIAGSLSDLGIKNLDGLNPEQMLAAISDALAPVGTTNDEAIAREALIVTLDGLYEKMIDDGKDITNLDQIGQTDIGESVSSYVSNYIFLKWMHELGLALEKGDLSVKQAVKLESEIKDYVRLEVQTAYENNEIDPFTMSVEQNKIIIDQILLTSYTAIKNERN